MATSKPKKRPASTSKRKPQKKPAYPLPVHPLLKVLTLPLFAKLYAVASVVILLATTVFWSLLGANVQRGNADQLVNPYLFEYLDAFRGALIPGTHTFLIKWPLFAAMQLFGESTRALSIVTVGVVVITIMGLAAIMYRIERRPLVFGSLCLALASVLLLVPAQPYAGGLLPVNMAMITTRNLEYLLYIGSLGALVTARRVRSWRFLLAVVGLAVLIASDKLFMILGLGGALAALISYTLLRRWRFAVLSARWLVGGGLAALLAVGLLWFVNYSGQTHIISQSGADPYTLAFSIHSLAIASVFTVMGILTNFGANPASNYSIIRTIPRQVYQGLVSPSGISFVINALLLAAGIYIVYRLLKASLLAQKKKTSRLSNAASLSLLLIWSSAASVIIFVLSNHDYAVDARYLAIVLFAVFVSAATFLRTRKWRPERVVLVGVIIVVGILLGLFRATDNYKSETSALSVVNHRDALVQQVLRNHPVSVLVGDYWRVVPIKQRVGDGLNIAPLATCTRFGTSLTSTSWQPNLRTHSFAYLLTLDGSPTNFPACGPGQIVAAYGRPNETTLIAGTLSQPRELLLFYDHGGRPDINTRTTRVAATVTPIPLADVPNTVCSTQTIMNVVAHEDDDLLFMNPDLQHSISAGDCVRTIYITTGDGGNGQFYWLNREQGAKAAYSQMLGSTSVWIQRIVELANHEYVTVANPRDNMRVSLIFIQLPDGNLRGQGFSDTSYESLYKLETGDIETLDSVYGNSYYTSAQLIDALTSLMHTYQPTEIRTQADYVSDQYPDHSDHIAVGNFVNQAYEQYEQQQFDNQVVIPIKYYVGYPIRGMDANVSGADLRAKEAAFLAYAKFDGATCQSEEQCQSAHAYGAYLTRQYQYPN